MIDMISLVEKLNVRFEGKLELSENGQSIYANKQNIVQLLQTLKEEFGFIRLVDITSVDYIERYEVVYHLTNDAIELLPIKVKLEKDDNAIPSIMSIWVAADPMEREVYDLMGIVFEGRENLTRILTPEDFVGHPLQKSFKLDKVSRF